MKKINILFFFVEKYLKTTVFGMTGHAPDYAMLMVRKKNVCF
jgi:GTPase